MAAMRRWTRWEEDFVEAEIARGSATIAIARAIGRSPFAVRVRVKMIERRKDCHCHRQRKCQN